MRREPFDFFGFATLSLGIHLAERAGRISAHDATIGRHIAPFSKQHSCQAEDEPDFRLEEGDDPWRRLQLTHPSDSRAGEDRHLSPLDESAVQVEQSTRRRR